MTYTANDERREAAMAYYEAFSTRLSEAHRDSNDPSIFVFENYLKWKGLPLEGTALRIEDDQTLISPHFSIMAYRLTDAINSYCTLGASYTSIPHSVERLNDPRGARYEYILHAKPDMLDIASELLFTITTFPFTQSVEIGPGFVLPIGEPIVENASMEYLYFTYPYIDDTNLYTETPWGQIERENVLIQVLWVFPIYYTEVQYLREHGSDMFEQLCSDKHQQQYDAYDFFRLPYV